MRSATLLIAACAWWLAAGPAQAQAAKPVMSGPDLATWHDEVGKLDCKDCHGPRKPLSVTPEAALETVNRQCMACHGSMATVAAKIKPRLAHAEINPHASHVVSIECVTCHFGHDRPSQAYCINCHAFEMPMPVGQRAARK